MSRTHLLATAVACAIALPSLASPAIAQPEDEGIECPDFMRDSKLALADTAGGSQFTITSPHPSYIPVIQAAFREAGKFVERRTAELASEPAETTVPMVKVKTRNIKGGIVITVRARKVGEISLLRQHTRAVETMWRKSSCNGRSRLPPGTVSA